MIEACRAFRSDFDEEIEELMYKGKPGQIDERKWREKLCLRFVHFHTVFLLQFPGTHLPLRLILSSQ
jgi:hypothetical protein